MLAQGLNNLQLQSRSHNTKYMFYPLILLIVFVAGVIVFFIIILPLIFHEDVKIKKDTFDISFNLRIQKRDTELISFL